MLYRFLDCELDEGTRTLVRAGGVVQVEPKVLDLLVHLIRCRERLVEKAELFARVWTDTYVSDASLMQCVRRARVAIGDTGGERAAIRTVRGRGYTFVAPVTVDAGLRAENEASNESPTEPGGGPGLFGRAAEIAAADEWLAATAAGSGGLLLIPGEAGVGKSMLAHRIAELAQARNFAVLWANGGTRLGSPPYWVWSQVLNAFAEAVEPPVLRHSLGVGAADLAELAPGLRQRLGELREAPVVDAEQLRARLLQAFLDWLRQASRRQPLLVVFDDVHLADRSSLMVLELAVQDAQSLSLGFVATCRVPDVDATRDAAATIDRLRVAGRCREIELVGWSEAQLADVAAAHLGDVPGADVAALWRRTQGVPFFVVELLRGARTAADLAGSAREVEVEGSVPTAVRALVRERLTSLTSDTRSFLEVAAVVGLDIVPEFVAALSGLDRGAVTAAMDEAEAHRMVVADAGYRFAHALFAEVLYSELPTFRRAQWHRAVAEEYGRVGREPAARAYHLTRANGCVDASVVVRALIDAGDEAAAKHAYDDALAHFEQALGRLDDSADADLQGQVLVKLTSSARYAGRILAARASGRRAATTALDLGDAEFAARAALNYSGLFYPRAVGRDPSAAEVLRDVLDRYPDLEASTCARVNARLASTQASGAAQGMERLRRVDAAVARSRGLGDAAAHAEVLLDAVLARLDVGSSDGLQPLAEELVAVGHDSGDREVVARGLQSLAVVFLQRGELESARAEIDRLEAIALELRLPEYELAATHLGYCVALQQGRFEEAQRMYSAQGALPRRGTRVVFQYLLFARLTGARTAGAGESMPRTDVSPELPWELMQVVFDADAGRRNDARAGLRELVDDDFRNLYAPSGLGTGPVVLAGLAHACALVDDVDVAKILFPHVDRQRQLWGVAPFGHVLAGPMARYAGQLAVILGDQDLARDRFELAIDQCERFGARGELVSLRFDYGMALKRSKSRGSQRLGRLQMERARELSAGLGVPWDAFAERADASPRRLGRASGRRPSRR